MALKRVFSSLFGAALLCSSASMAAEYRPNEYFSLDLSKAVLSPKPLGPAAAFEQVPIEANADRTSEPQWAREELKTEPRSVATETVTMPHRMTRAASVKGTGSARMHLAHRRRNPLDSQAMDTRIQTWPCRSGGICNWKQ
jgi:hypothetical protein